MSSQIIDSVKGKQKRKILEFIYSQRKDGARHTDVQRFIVEDLKGFNYDEKDDNGKRRWRGYYATSLYGYGHNQVIQSVPFQVGIYRTYCDKVGKRYFIKKEFLKKNSRKKVRGGAYELVEYLIKSGTGTF